MGNNTGVLQNKDRNNSGSGLGLLSPTAQALKASRLGRASAFVV